MTSAAEGGRLPGPKSTLDAALADVRACGVGVLAGALSRSETDDVRARIWDIVARKKAAGKPDFVPADADDRNIRVLNIVNWDVRFTGLACHVPALAAARAVIGERILLSNFGGNIMGPGAGSMVLHSDQGYVAEPWPPMALAVNVMWIIDEYREELGATRIVPGTHLATGNPDPDSHFDTVAIEAEAGSMAIMDGRVWHTSGINTTTDRYRAALFAYYTVPWIRQQINWRETLDPEIVAQCSEDFLELAGYRLGNRELFNPGARRQREAALRNRQRPRDQAPVS